MQSFDVGPAHVWHDDEQATQLVPSLKLPSGHATPAAVDGKVVHLVASFWSCVKCVPHLRQLPVPSAQVVHPSWQTLQSPVEVAKNPLAHLAQAVPLAAVVQPGLHAHEPSEPHSPLRQLHVFKGDATGGSRHLPVPDMPSSHVAQPAGHAWHVGPKKPAAQVSQAVPLNPGAHVQVPEAEHVPELAQGGEQVEDCMSRRDMDPELRKGSCAVSGTESHITTRPFDPKDIATQTLDAMASDWAARGVDALATGAEGSELKAALPE